jgi:pyruvate dehydrogenase E2 component (dihydrolipoamide acetyltransferase)
MAIPVIMPKQGQSVETCIITKWFKKKGDTVKTGDLLFSYETDKAAFDTESQADGILLEIFYHEGDEVPVLENVAVIGQPGENIQSFKESNEIKSPDNIIDSEETKQEPEVLHTKSEFFKESAAQAVRISPRAKRYAEKNLISISNIKGSGPNGRIICSDVEKAASSDLLKESIDQSTSEEFILQPLSNIRKTIARAMHTSLQNSAQLTHHMSADVRRLLEMREKIKSAIHSDGNQQDITLNDMICWCVLRALEKFPEINSHYLGNEIKIFRKINLGIAVDTARGLMVPAIKNAGAMDLTQLSKELKSAADECRRGDINPDLLQSSTASFTVSNLGNYGVEMFTPVINLPQSAILGVCTIVYRPTDLGNKTFGFVPFIGLSLTYDHRAVDGGPATLFLKEIKEQIEKFSYQNA